MRRLPVVRRERWLSLPELADLMKLTQPSRAARRRAALRVVRMAEELNRIRISKRVGNKVYVSTVLLENLFPIGDDRIFNVENALADLSQKAKALDRQVQNQGARVGKLERWRKLTTEYLGNAAALE
jgi:hypothetical protein